MNDGILNLVLMIILGTVSSVAIYIIINRLSKKIIWFFQLYPESQSIMNIASKFISFFVSIIVFFLFLRIGLMKAGFDFTSKFIESTVLILPRYISAVLVILFGKFAIKILDNIVEKYDFEYKQEFLAIVNTILLVAFVITAFMMIGIDVDVFSSIFNAVILSLGIMIAIIIGIPIGLRIYDSKKNKHKSKIKRSHYMSEK